MVNIIVTAGYDYNGLACIFTEITTLSYYTMESASPQSIKLNTELSL